jgi:hypothetical protein
VLSNHDWHQLASPPRDGSLASCPLQRHATNTYQHLWLASLYVGYDAVAAALTLDNLRRAVRRWPAPAAIVEPERVGIAELVGQYFSQ